eukprot:gene8316-27437_t
MFIYRDINFDSLESKFTTEEVGQMIGQKLEAWSWLKHHMSEKSKVKRQKHVFIIDFKGGSLGGMLVGKRAKTFKYGLSTAADHFPNSLFKMYLYNTPFIFRATWGMKRMMELDGFAEADLPTAIGGLHEGRTCYDVLQDAIVANGGTPDYLNGKMPKDSCFIDGLPGAAAKGAPQSTVEAVHGAATHGDSPFPFYPTPLGTLL